MNRLGIELLSVFGMPPVENIALAADLGCAFISTGLTQLPFNPHGYPAWSLRDDPLLRREMIAAMRDRDVTISLGEGFAIRPGVDMRDRGAEMDIFAELGAQRLGGVCMEPDLGRTYDQFAILAQMAEDRGMLSSIEFAPIHPVGNLEQALAVVRHVGKPGFRLLIDAMHFFRSGGVVADLAAVDPDLIGYIQLCDVPMVPVQPDYMQEAMFDRRVPGTGELPLQDLLAALPRDRVIGLEVPRLAEAEAGIAPFDRLAPAVAAARKLLETIG